MRQLRLPPITTKPKITILNPQSEPAIFSTPTLFAHVSQGKTHKKCQDRVLIVEHDKFKLLGVFDGHGPVGVFFSQTLASRFGEECMEKPEVALANLVDTIRSIALGFDYIASRWPGGMKISDYMGSGTTATLALILPDGSFDLVSVGDSPAYRLDKTPEYFFEPTISNTVAGLLIGSKDLDPLTYRGVRNVLTDTVEFSGIRGLVDEHFGVLSTGEILILASDGLSKNLSLPVDGKGKLVSLNGIEDLERFVFGCVDAKAIGELLVPTILKRMTLNFPPYGYRKVIRSGRVLLPSDDDLSVVILKKE